MPSPIKLVCFDIDDTMINGHLHRSLEQAGVMPGKADEATVLKHLETIGGIKNRMALQKTLKDLLKSGVNIAVTSYTSYAESIPPILRAIGLSAEEIARVKCASFTPPKMNGKPVFAHYGKNNHIDLAIQSFGGNIRPEEVVLVDDRVENYQLARQKGYNVVWVQGGEGRVDYLDELRELAGLATSRATTMAQVPTPAAPPAQSWVDRVLGWFGLQRVPSPALDL